MKERPIILIPVMPATVLERLEPLLKVIEEREMAWAEGLAEFDAQEFERHGLMPAYTSQMADFCSRARKLKAVAEIACGPYHIEENDALWMETGLALSKAKWFDTLIRMAEERGTAK
ncbi:hypothetical protein [Burkholderia glumae]|uniref:hypothetical protein n=1 Tax=Burkholderia glumae TaxID=337 RepID=UPI00215123AE|nr:hypothetical protein [Burkholderia glumae]